MSDSLPPASYPSYSLGSNPRRVPTSDGLPMYRVTRMSVWLCHLATTLYEMRVSVTRLLTSTRYKFFDPEAREMRLQSSAILAVMC